MHYMNLFRKAVLLSFLFLFIGTATAAVFVRTTDKFGKIMDKLASKLEYTSELEVNGAPGVVSVYTLHELFAIERLAKYLGFDHSRIADNGFKVKLKDEQGGGMLFAIANNSSEGNQNPLVIHFSCPEKGTPKWLFPEIASPTEDSIQFSVKDASRDMSMCTYLDEGSAGSAVQKVKQELISNGWECVTPGNAITGMFFAKGDSVILVSATPQPDANAGSTVLIMKKK